MSRRWHVGKDGTPKPCRAQSVESCYLGGAHFDSARSVADYLEKLNEDLEVPDSNTTPRTIDSNRERSVRILENRREINRLAEDGLTFGRNSARNTDISEGGAQVLVLALARGESIDDVEDSKDLLDKTEMVDSNSMNLEEIHRLGAKLQNEVHSDSGPSREKIRETVNSAKEVYSIFKSNGLSDEEISQKVRWMGKENTKGANSTVGDVGITRDNGENIYISLKVASKGLHNSSMVNSLKDISEDDFNPYENDKDTMKFDAQSFSIASKALRDKLHNEGSAEFSHKDETWRIEERENGEKYITYEKRSKNRALEIPASALTKLSEFKKLKKNEQKILSSFITSYRNEFENKDSFMRANSETMRSVSENMKNRIGDSPSDRKKIAAKFLGLRNDSPYYVNSLKTSVASGKIPSKEDFLNNEKFEVGEPVATNSGLLIPIANRDNGKMSILKIRTRYTDGTFNYSDLKSTSEYSVSPADRKFFEEKSEYKNFEITPVNESIFVRP